ncbi:hypothetical protein CSC00_3053 [Klebsiella pneumoniae]|nr:hypothetical protein CSC00_3053 [Klebsiella pneumoniae]
MGRGQRGGCGYGASRHQQRGQWISKPMLHGLLPARSAAAR